MKEYVVSILVIMDDDTTDEDAKTWATSMLETAFKKKNPISRAESISKDPTNVWHAQVPMSPQEHPYKPQVLGAVDTTYWVCAVPKLPSVSSK